MTRRVTLTTLTCVTATVLVAGAACLVPGGAGQALADVATTTTSPACDPPASGGLTMTRLPVPEGYSYVQVGALTESGAVMGNAWLDGTAHGIVWDPAGRFHDLGGLPGGSSARALAINEQGEVAGVAGSPSGDTHAVIWRHGRITDLGTAGGRSSSVVGLDDAGTVFGTVWSSDDTSRAVRWDAQGHVTLLPGLGGAGSSTQVHNTMGMSAGQATTRAGVQDMAFWDRHGQVTDIMQARSNQTSATAMNDRGVVVLHNYLDGAFRWDRVRGLVALPDPADGRDSYPLAINDAGTVAGMAFRDPPASVGNVAVRWSASGKVEMLPYLPGTDEAYAVAMNSSGTVVGENQLPNGMTHAVRWSPSGAVSDLGGVGSCGASDVMAINDHGVIAGDIRLPDSYEAVPVLWR